MTTYFKGLDLRLLKPRPARGTLRDLAAGILWAIQHLTPRFSIHPIQEWRWLAREGKIVITPEKRSFRIQLEDTHTTTVGHRLS
jgi:hypothetical protein